MKLLKRVVFVSATLSLFAFSPLAYAATSPALGQADPFSVLSSSFVNTAPGTVLNGDLGYTTGPAVPATVNGHTRVADATYNQAGIDQGTALASLNSQPCTFSFAPGPIDLASDTTHGTVGLYAPGVYCIAGATSIGGGGTITLTGAGTYIFRMNGALTSSANSIVTLANGASACNVWWTPTAATTLGANSTFLGTVIDASGISIGSTITWTGRALAFGGTVSTSVDTINTVPACGTASTAEGLGTGSRAVGLPNTGLAPPQANRALWLIPVTITAIAAVFYVARKRKLSADR
ncbi:MAG: ice-binding family protein [Candidatus Saccharimonadales bacterium]